MTPETLAKLSADMGMTVRPAPPPQVGGDDFPHRYQHETGEFDKRQALLEGQNHRCAYCGTPVHDFERKQHDPNRATIDEVVPRVAGGKCVWSNQVIACRLCNEGRSAMRAERYFEAVLTMGRWKANVWGRTEQRAAQHRLNKHRRPQPGDTGPMLY